MATTYQNPPRPIGRPFVPKSRIKTTTSEQLPSTITNNSQKIKIRLGNNSQQNSMHKPSSILKKKPFERPYNDQFNRDIVDWHQPSDLEKIHSRPVYSPIHTPPRLRTLITPAGIEPYRNLHNLRRFHSPLPVLDDWYSPPVHLDTWGLNPSDYNLTTANLNLIRRYPSPLSNYGLGSPYKRQKKSYIVVPRLTRYISPPVSSGGANFTLPSHRMSPVYVPDSQYTYLERIHSFLPSPFHRELTDYMYVRQNEAFANSYIEDFIGKCIEDQLIPDLLLEIIGEIDQENKERGGKSYRTEVARYNADLNKRINQQDTNNTHTYSDTWIRELDNQRQPVPASNIDSNLSSLKPLDFKEIPSTQKTHRVGYHDLPGDVQGRLLADINQELINYETATMITDLSTQTLTNRVHSVPIMNDSSHDMYNSQRHQVQYNSIEQYAQNKPLDTIFLDQLIIKYIKQNGSIVDVDDLSRLLDVNILENLIHQHQTIDENRSRTLDNYGSRKFHLNSFMNITMDLLLTELSASLIEDMKDLDEQERRIFS